MHSTSSRHGRRRTDRAPLARTAVAVLALLLLLVVPGHAQRDDDLDRIREDIARLRGRLDGVRRQAQSATRELEEVELELGIRTHELELATAAESRLVTEQVQIETEVAALGPRMERRKEELRARLGALYRMGQLSYLRLLLSYEGEEDPIRAMSMLGYLVSRDARLVAEFRDARTELEVRRKDLADRHQRLLQARAVIEQRRKAVEVARADQQRVLARLKKEETGASRELAALEEKARRLQRLVTSLSEKRPGTAAALDIHSVQGALAWPVEGKVLEKFGRQRNPKFATFTVNNGLTIEAAPGTPVRAVFQGTVLFSQWFKGYGNLIILDHGNRVFSLYGNLKQSSVAAGDVIATGQTIAGVGESEDADSGHLYFEIRNDNRPEDPQKWLR